MADTQDALADWFANVLAEHADAVDQREHAYYALDNAGLLSKVTVHRYQCSRDNPCQIARVIKIGSNVLCAVRDYKYSPGLNQERSVESARVRNTLNGDNHWPGHVHDVVALSEWGDQAGMDMVCRHYRGTIFAKDILATVEGIPPGRPGKPTRLS